MNGGPNILTLSVLNQSVKRYVGEVYRFEPEGVSHRQSRISLKTVSGPKGVLLTRVYCPNFNVPKNTDLNLHYVTEKVV